MKKTEDLIKDTELWAGLNKPCITEDEADVVVFGISYDGSASFRSGAKKGPQAIREISFTITPTTEDFECFDNLKVFDKGDFVGENQEKIFNDIEVYVAELVSKKKFFTMLGGDHSVSIPVFRGINKAIDKNFGIIHIDAHFDLNDTFTGSKTSHGCPARRATELEKVGGIDGLFFIGIRSVEFDELEYMKNHNVNVVSARQFSEMGVDAVIAKAKEAMKDKEYVYITVDIDSLDPAYAAGTGTPQFGGLSSRELLNLLRGLFELPIIGFDVVEVAPDLDPSLTSVFAARKIITECWGHKFLDR